MNQLTIRWGRRPRLMGLLLGSLALVSAPAAADNQSWAALSVSGPSAEGGRLLLWFDGHARFSDMPGDLDISIVRPGFGWRTGPGLDLWAGYARITGYRAGPNLAEDRLWQQATYGIVKPWGGALSGRTRLEQRFRGGHGDTGWRLRQFVRFSRPLGDGRFSFVATDELFLSFNTTGWGQRGGYDQNRAFLGAAWHPAKNLRFETGYMNQHIKGASANETRNNVVLSAFVTL